MIEKHSIRDGFPGLALVFVGRLEEATKQILSLGEEIRLVPYIASWFDAAE